jgi:hypothetical protein
MALSFLQTTRFKLRALKGSSLVSDIDAGFAALAEDVDSKVTGYLTGTHAARPVAGNSHLLYKETDTGLIFVDTGTWEELGRWTEIAAAISAAEAHALTASSISAVGARTARNLSEAFTPSLTRPTLVTIDVQLEPSSVSGAGVNLYVNGVQISPELFQQKSDAGVDSNARLPATFIVPKGQAWEAVVSAGAASSLRSSYCFL